MYLHLLSVCNELIGCGFESRYSNTTAFQLHSVAFYSASVVTATFQRSPPSLLPRLLITLPIKRFQLIMLNPPIFNTRSPERECILSNIPSTHTRKHTHIVNPPCNYLSESSSSF